VEFHLQIPVVLIIFGHGGKSASVHGRTHKESWVRRPGRLAAQLHKVIEFQVGAEVGVRSDGAEN
jgi:hypothetical protein